MDPTCCVTHPDVEVHSMVEAQLVLASESAEHLN